MRVCVIPARGGSKRIPRKNIRPFCGQPMILHPIRAALASGVFDRVMVSTDDAQIAAVARAGGAEVPFTRPADLSDDHATSVAVIAHAARWLAANGPAPTYLCCLYATAPFVTPDHLAQGLERLLTTGARYAFPVTRFAFPIQRALRRDTGGGVSMFHPEHAMTRSQDLEDAFHDAGAFYWGTQSAWGTGAPIYDPASTTIVLPRHLVQDIDTEEDWTHAEILYRTLHAREERS
jgi:pseudaminic acid cytidylyltransferase